MQLRILLVKGKLDLGCHGFLFKLHNTLLLEDELWPVYLLVIFNIGSVIPNLGD